MSLIAHKFGGSSLANAERIAAVVELMAARADAAQVIVVSAMQGVTNALIALAETAASGGDVDIGLYALKQQHDSAAVALLGAQAHLAQSDFAAKFTELAELLKALRLLGDAPKGALEFISGLGEVFSAHLVTLSFRAKGYEAHCIDARDILRVEHTELGCQVLWPESEARLAAYLRAQFADATNLSCRLIGETAKRFVVTGFVARDQSGRITTLGRNGSDYSGSIFAALFDAAELHIWTDVDGVLSADPRQVPEAQVLSHMSYQEAFELAYFGAKVIHPQTMAPATRKNLPVFIHCWVI